MYAVGGIDANGTRVATIEAFTPPASPNANTWATKAAMPTARGALSAAEVNGKIYAIGGNDIGGQKKNANEEYDPASNTWAPRQPMPIARTEASAAVVDGIIYVFGGYQTESLLQAYDPLNDLWSSKASMPTPRSATTSAALSGKIYVIGGNTSSGNSNVVEEYDPITDSWTNCEGICTPMPTRRETTTSIVINGLIYVFVGHCSIGNPWCNLTGDDTIVEAFDPINNSWLTKNNSPVIQRAVSGLIGSKVYVFGGGSTYEYDLDNDSWTPKASYSDAGGLPGGVVVRGVLYVLGGYGSNVVKAYTP